MGCMKVRHTTRCAGGCRTVLVVGTLAERRHRGVWCPGCYDRHRARCRVCAERDQRQRRPAMAGQPPLW